MCADVVAAESLHAEVVDEAMCFQRHHICFDLLQSHFFWDKSQRNREPVTFESSKSERLPDALKAPAFDLGIPVLAALLPDELLCVGPQNCDKLRGGAALVLVARDLELAGKLADSLGYVVHRLHRVYIGLVQSYAQVLRLCIIARFTVIHFHFLACGVR